MSISACPSFSFLNPKKLHLTCLQILEEREIWAYSPCLEKLSFTKSEGRADFIAHSDHRSYG